MYKPNLLKNYQIINQEKSNFLGNASSEMKNRIILIKIHLLRKNRKRSFKMINFVMMFYKFIKKMKALN